MIMKKKKERRRLVVKSLVLPKRKIPSDRYLLYYAEILTITFKKIKDLTHIEAKHDGFSNRKEAVKAILEINHKKLTKKTIELYCYITTFRRTEKTDATKSILFTRLKDKLLSGEKTSTVRMVTLPPYIEGETVMILFKKEETKNLLLSYL